MRFNCFTAPMAAMALLLAATVSTVHASQIHTLEAGAYAVKKNFADTRTLVFKVKDSAKEAAKQNSMFYLDREGYAQAPLFPRLSQLNAHNAQILGARKDVSEFSRYFVRHFPKNLEKNRALEILTDIYRDPNTDFAYFEPRIKDAVAIERLARPLSIPRDEAAPLNQPELASFEADQFYLNPAPEGIDARVAWGIPGGTGQGIRVIDVETGWHTDHVEFGPVFYDNGKNGRTDHGTAVWGEVAAKPDGKGITGIAYDVQWGIAGNGFSGGFEEYPVLIASEIEKAALQLNPGDVLIIEQHAPLVDDYGPIEYFEPVFKALQLATSRGVLCVAAAGNGYSNLDDEKYKGVFDLNVRDSGCIMVGAVDSPKGMRVRQRSGFSNYGSRVDAYGYGEDVVSAGYGDLFNGRHENKLATYTATFSGTSSATPIVAGAVASLSGIAKAKSTVLNPGDLRRALRATGTAQENKSADNVGTMPNIPELLKFLNLN